MKALGVIGLLREGLVGPGEKFMFCRKDRKKLCPTYPFFPRILWHGASELHLGSSVYVVLNI